MKPIEVLLSVIEDDELSDGAKVTYGRIIATSLRGTKINLVTVRTDRNVSRTTLYRHIRELENAGYVDVETLKAGMFQIRDRPQRIVSSIYKYRSSGVSPRNETPLPWKEASTPEIAEYHSLEAWADDLYHRHSKAGPKEQMRLGIHRKKAYSAYDLAVAAKVLPKDLQPLALLGRWFKRYRKLKGDAYTLAKDESLIRMYQTIRIKRKSVGAELLSQATDYFLSKEVAERFRYIGFGTFISPKVFDSMVEQVQKTRKKNHSAGDSKSRRRVTNYKPKIRSKRR